MCSPANNPIVFVLFSFYHAIPLLTDNSYNSIIRTITIAFYCNTGIVAMQTLAY